MNMENINISKGCSLTAAVRNLEGKVRHEGQQSLPNEGPG